jgi:hypothetical protein
VAILRAVQWELSTVALRRRTGLRGLGDRLRAAVLRRPRLSGYRIALGIVLLLTLGFYMWTAASTVPFSFSPQNNTSDIYNELTTGFLQGHTYLAQTPPAGLLHLKNPYDPAANAPYQGIVNFAAFYHGHLYSAWGPTPVVTLFLPFRITGLRMSESFSVALYGFIGLVCAVALLHMLVRRLVPGTPNWLLLIASAGLALSNVVPFLARRPTQYEVAVASGYCFAMAGLLLLGKALTTRRRQSLLLACGSLCLGLAVGGRISLVPVCLAVGPAAWYLIRRRNQSYRVLIPLLVPLAACAALLLAYNAVRFGSISEFGSDYQIATVNTMTRPATRLAYVPPGLFSYLLIPPRFALTFPHVFLKSAADYPFPFPNGYQGSPSDPYVEPAGGLLPMAPITLLLFVLPFAWRRWRDQRRVWLAAAGLSVLGLLVVGDLSYALWGTTQRYEVDYVTLFLLPAFLVWAALYARLRGRRLARRGVAILGVAMTAFGVFAGAATSITGYYDELATEHPSTFSTLEDITSPFATIATMISGHAGIARVYGPLPVTLPADTYGRTTESGAGTWLGSDGAVTVVIDAPSAQSNVLVAGAQPGAGTPRGTHFAVRVQSPGRASIVDPVRGPIAWMPIHLHWGLNRIKLSLASPTPRSPESLFLAGLSLAS